MEWLDRARECESLKQLTTTIMKSKVLVTGVAGFIGAHVAGECLRQGFAVTGVDDLSGGFVENVPAGVRFVRASVTDDREMERLFAAEKFDYVFHLGAYAAEGLSHFIRRFNYETNLGGSISLINAAIRHEIKCFFFTSSIAVYGRNQLPMLEELTPQPEDPYGVSKYAVELDLRAAHEMFGLNSVVFRPHNVYGELQNIADKYRNVIGIFMNQLLQGKPMSIFGDGRQTRDFVSVHDVARANLLAATLPRLESGVVNICTGEAQKELIGPGLLAMLVPILVGYGLGVGLCAIVIEGARHANANYAATITFSNLALAFGMMLIIAGISSAIAARKVLSIDPFDIFRG